MRVGIINVTGYVGAELARILARHPEVELAEVTGKGVVGQQLGSLFPHLGSLGLTITGELESVDFAFCALPHHSSADMVPKLLDDGLRVVDLSGDFRLKDPDSYRKWYGIQHPAPELLSTAVYGLSELHGGDMSTAQLVANPGCHPTSAILALAPLVRFAEREYIVDSKAGVSDAGRPMKMNSNHYGEVNESVMAYGFDGHRHQPEIAQELDGVMYRAIYERGVDVTFMPHIVPMTRGLLATCYARLKKDMTQSQLMELYSEFYAAHPFVQVAEMPPTSKQTMGSNYCMVYPRARGGGRVVVVSCLDNLVKGAAGQAVQNMNSMMGFPPEMGLDGLPIYP